jgi:hypothetical protein
LKEPKGIRRSFWLPKEVDTKAEEVRKTLGLRTSAFYRFAIIELIKQFAQCKTTAKEGENHGN